MGPAQNSAGTDVDIKPNMNPNVAAESKAGHKLICNAKNEKSFNNLETSISHMEDRLDEKLKAPSGPDDMAVDVTEFKRSSDRIVATKEDLEETECSSSFADTASGTEICSGLSDAEVESQFYEDGCLTSAFDGFGSFFPVRKKKLTGHWRSFIRPLMWRCKWTELKVKEFQSQAEKYAKELAAYDRLKHAASNQQALEESGSRSLPFLFQSHRRKLMKRRKRKKLEDTTDGTSFMFNHHLFSYHVAERKKSDLDGTSIADDFGHSVLKERNTNSGDDFCNIDDWSCPGDKDNILEQTLQKIELVHTRVHKMKAQLDSIMTKYAFKFSSSESLSHLVPGDAQNSSFPSPTFSGCNGDTMSVGGLCSPQHIIEYNFGDFIMPDSMVSTYGEAILVPDVIESTVGLMSSADVTHQQSHVGDSCEKIVENVLMHNESFEMEGQTDRKIDIQSTEKHQDSDNSGEGESSARPLPAASESDVLTRTCMSQEQSTLKSCLASDVHFPKIKRKRGERKAGSGGWNRQVPGEPDSQ